MSELHTRLREARIKAGYKSARSAALRFDWRPSTYAAHENGQNSFDAPQATIYARAFKADLEWLYFGIEKAKPESGGFVHIPAGFVYNSGLVSMAVKSLEETIPVYNIFTTLPSDVKIFQFLDETMWPQHNKNDLLVCWDFRNFTQGEFIGSESVVELEDGSFLLRQIEASGEAERFNLVSQKLPLIRSVKLVNAWTKLAAVAKAGYGTSTLPVKPGDYPRLEDSPHYEAARASHMNTMSVDT